MSCNRKQDDFFINIGKLRVNFFEPIVYLSSYYDDKYSAYGPYWARIVDATPNHIIINFYGYEDKYNIYLHCEDLPYLGYKFNLPGSEIYKIFDLDREALLETHGIQLDLEESYVEHNNLKFIDYLNNTQHLVDIYKLSPNLITQLTSYDFSNSPVAPFFKTQIVNLPSDNPEISKLTINQKIQIVGSRNQWKSVDVKPDGDCLFRAIANGLNYIRTDGKVEWGFSNPEQDKLQRKLRTQAVEWLCDLNNWNQIAPGEITVMESIPDQAEYNGFTIGLDKESLGDDIYDQIAISNYCEEMKNSNSWGSLLEIFALANIYNIAINVYYQQPGMTVEQSYDQYYTRVIPTDLEYSDEINIYWINSNHYRIMYPNIDNTK